MKFFFVLLSCFFSICPAFAAEEVPLRAGLAQTASSPDPQTAALASLLDQSIASYEKVIDYRAEFMKQERSKGALGPRERIFLKFEKPFKIFMHWIDTRKKGLQVLYERGRHNGKLAIHKPGLFLGLAPVVFLDQNSPWVREGSEKYDIEDAGIGTFLYDFAEMVLKGAAENKISARVSDSAEGRSVDVSFPGSQKGAGYFASRIEAFFDAGTKLPVRMKLYDWNGEITGTYEYNDLRLNVGTEDPEFKKIAQKKLYNLFLPTQRIVQRNNFSRNS